VGNDGVSVLGVNWHVGIRPVRVLGLSGGSDYDGAGHSVRRGTSGRQRAGDSAVIAPPAQGARIINVSLGGGCSLGTNPAPGLDVLHDAVMAATDPGLPNGGSLIVASAGNSASSCPTVQRRTPKCCRCRPWAAGDSGELFEFRANDRHRRARRRYRREPAGQLGRRRNLGVFSTVCDFTVDPCTPTQARYEGTSMAAPH
jgi:hypothetical protein